MSVSRPQLYISATFLLGWPISILSFYFLFRITSGKISSLTTVGKPLLFPFTIGVLCFLIYFYLRSLLWKQILKYKGHDIPLKESSYLWCISELSRFVPGNIWAPLSRGMLFGRKNVSKITIVKSLITESQLVVVGSFLVALVSFPFLLTYLTPSLPQKELLVTLTVIAIISATIFFLFSKKIIGKHKKIQLLLPDLSAKHVSTLVIIITLSFFFFGLGSYFVIASFVFLSPLYVVSLIGFFTFSYIIGYLSFITPMGLGVREGVTAFGLAKLIPATHAVSSAIIVRLVLIAAELLFFIFALCWRKVKIPVFDKVMVKINKDPHLSFVFLFIAIFCLYFTTASFLRHSNFYTGRFDLGNMDQTVWNSSQGRIFQLTDPDGTEVISRLAFHADFMLVLLAPLYYIWNDPRMLLLVQTFTAAIGAYFVYKISEKVLGNKSLSVVLSFAYLLDPSLQHAILYDFHAVNLATTFLLAAFYYLLQRKNVLFILFALLAALTKEQVWVILAAFGFLITVFNLYRKNVRRSLFGFSLFLISLFMFYLLIWKLIPQVRGSDHFAISYYSDFGDNPSAIIRNVLFNPGKILGVTIQPARIHYLFQLFLPLGFTSLLAPLLLVFALPDLLINVLSGNNQLHEIYYQYTATITPFVFMSGIYGIRNLRRILPRVPIVLYSVLIILCTLYASYDYGPIPGDKSPNIDMFIKPHPHATQISAYLQNVPQAYSVAATNNIGAHLSHRDKIFTIPIGVKQADIIAFLLDDPFAQPSPVAQRKMVADLRNNPKYKKVYEVDNFVVFERIKTQ